jgi:hypothetical protein
MTTMRLTIYLLTLALVLCGYKNQAQGKMANKNIVNAMQTASDDKQPTNIYIKDKSQYDPAFIGGLSAYNEPISLIDNYIITGRDTTYFPENLSLNKAIVFKASKGNNKYVLTVIRTSLTNLNYNFKLTDNDDKTLDSKSGKSVLGSMFFLGSEMDKDALTAEEYASCEYWNKTNDCWFSIRIGKGKDRNGKQRAMLTYGCEDKNKRSLKVDECPTLRTE